jgi:hypothetical protein
MPISTFRVDLVTGVTAMMNAYIAANPTKLLRHYRSLPAQFQDLPCSYLDVRPETVSHANGLRDRVVTPSIVVVTRLTDNGETTDIHDILVDSLLDWFTSYPHIVTGTIWSDMTIADEAVGADNQFVGTRFSFGNISIAEGRT